MKDNQSNQFPFIIISDNNDSFDLRQVLDKYFYHWRFFVLCLVISITGAIILVRFAQPVYEIKASILIQDGQKYSDEKSTLQEIEGSHSSKLVENEMEVLRSRKLILQVVNTLQLWKNYQLKDGYKDKELYNTSPIHFDLLERAGHLDDQKFEILIKDHKTFVLNDPERGKLEYVFNKEYQNEVGSWNIESAPNINDFIGEIVVVSINDPEIVAEMYQENLEVSLLNEDAPIISLVLADHVAERGKDFLNTLIDHYTTATIAEKTRKNNSTLDFIDQRLASLTGELATAEGQVEVFRSNRGLTDISSHSQVYLQNVHTNDIRLNEVNVQLNVIDGIEEYINSSASEENYPSVTGILDPGLNHLIQQLSQLRLRKAELLATTPESNPIFNPINKQINSTNLAIKDNLSNIKSALLTTQRELESINSDFESSIRDIPGQERQLVGIKRQQSIKENLYMYLLQKREALSLSYAATLADARVVDSAYAGQPQGPKKFIILGAAFVLGFMFPVVLIHAKEILNNKVTTRREIEEKVKAPIVMEMSLETVAGPTEVLDEHMYPVSEQFRSLRTQLNFLHGPRKSGRVTLLTSSISEEGKSFACVNLGAALAASQRKTIIIDLDLRKPKISEIFNLPEGHSGISDYLVEQAAIKEIIQPSGIHPKLDVITSGQFSSNPSELLEQPGMDSLLKFLRAEYDDILLDTPPVQLVTDASVISHLSDVTLYLIRQGYTYKSLLSRVAKLYDDQHFQKMNIIFNGIEEGRYGYGSYYGRGYYRSKNKKKIQF